MTSTAFPGISTPAGPLPVNAPGWNRQRHSQMPSHRYADPYDRVAIPLSDAERTWPTRRFTAAPLWVPVDLRDGNQALAEPMDPARKRRFFDLMVAMGYKEIEVGYPSASQTDFDFVRLIAEQGIAPEDVTIVVFTAARRDLIARTVEAVRGIRNPVVIHLYTATAPIWRETVLGRDRDELRELILDAGRDVRALAGDLPRVRFEFSPEVFMLTEPDYALEVCNAMTALWEATPERPVILNLPATVEIATPNVYADQIEYMHRNLERREGVILSVHPHNDRGTGIACAELALLAGAERIEGCLFGNGERTGNVDLVTLALNLHAQGIDPMIDFSDIDEIRRTVEHSNRIEVHPRHPYVGDLVHTAFSGTHQDAIRKGFAEHRARAACEGRTEREIAWRVPYLPVDPADLGRSYDAVIRVNSQSGKGGIAYLLETGFGVQLPRRLQIDLAGHVQRRADESGAELDAHALWRIFDETYLGAGDDTRIALSEVRIEETAAESRVAFRLRIDDVETHAERIGVGPVEAVTAEFARRGLAIEVLDLHQTSIGSGNAVEALTLLEHRSAHGTGWVAGRDRSVLTATLNAVVAAADAALRTS
ncbi:2-isopropylmalate synthase [Microbacterium azadirachtae]|uniref:2-isopropylmalate synthase n=1 Tax=Microbacterium azadirachtae TaxID=582680 RepID=A0A0F0LIQ4_9MICO|nr:2-isopropylmalate synthase [Microbacterium azadirachtae]KJL31411.1 2-isopropylmalate synthase [Microbacterium azadirachtae]